VPSSNQWTITQPTPRLLTFCASKGILFREPWQLGSERSATAEEKGYELSVPRTSGFFRVDGSSDMRDTTAACGWLG